MVSEQVNLFMPKSKNIYFERKVPREIMRPSFRATKFIYLWGSPPCSLPPAPFPLLWLLKTLKVKLKWLLA
jgi:hypothetical protein